MTSNETIFKNIRFDMLTIGSHFTTPDAAFASDATYVKTSARKAKLKNDDGQTVQFVEFNVKGGTIVTIPDQQAMEVRDKQNAKPLFDGTEASCRTRQEFYTLDAALRDVVNATQKLDEMADWTVRKMADIKQSLRRGDVVEHEMKNSWDTKFTIQPKDAVDYNGLNSCGEIQGNGNIDMLIATLLAKREAFSAIVIALGYRVK